MAVGIRFNFLLAFFSTIFLTTALPTSYEYYTSDGIKSGLSTDQPYFTLNGKNISIFSGAMHYFRVPRAYWRDRLRKMRAAGLNAVETYIPWNLHEYQSGRYDFGAGGSDMEDFLNITEFLRTAQEEDLFAIIRSGPYICAEFEYGGLPSWLLRENNIRVRSSDPTFMKYVGRFFNTLMPILARLQFTKGGPIIAFQVENEFGYNPSDEAYLKGIRDYMVYNGIVELLVTADSAEQGDQGSIPDLFLMTANFGSEPEDQLNKLRASQPGKPSMVMEYWDGSFDTWANTHGVDPSSWYVGYIYEQILNYPASVNLYMFTGGTNFGFLSGAQNVNYDDNNAGFSPITSSYDYLAPISEAGDYTDKYYVVQDLLSKYNPIKTELPKLPKVTPTFAYPTLAITEQLLIEDALESIEPVFSKKLIPMEKLDINNNSGQSYGYIVYRQENIDLDANATLTIEGRVCDTLMVLVNGVLVSPILEEVADLDVYGTWRIPDSTLVLTTTDLKGATLDLIVENWSRVNAGSYRQLKGLHQGNALINDVVLTDWTIFPLEFRTSWTNALSGWGSPDFDTVAPSLYRTTLEVSGDPRDTFVYLENWTKGIVIVNGFVLGRYARIGPIQTLYLPAPLLREGSNDIVIFEHYKAAESVEFSTEHIYADH